MLVRGFPAGKCIEEILMATATVSTATVPITTVEHPLRNPNYRLWLIGGTISLLGDQFYLVALPWLVLQQTGSAVAMGAIMMAGAIPRALLMLMGGAVSDRMSARKIMIATAMARTICVTVIGVLVWLRILRTWELYALAVAFGVADAFAVPAQTAYMPSLLKREQLVAASSVSQSTGQLTTIVGPVPAGFVIKTLGVAWAFFVDAISFLFIIGALWKLPDPPKSQTARKQCCTRSRRESPTWEKECAAALADAAGHDPELLHCRAGFDWSRLPDQNEIRFACRVRYCDLGGCRGKFARRAASRCLEDSPARRDDSSGLVRWVSAWDPSAC